MRMKKHPQPAEPLQGWRIKSMLALVSTHRGHGTAQKEPVKYRTRPRTTVVQSQRMTTKWEGTQLAGVTAAGQGQEISCTHRRNQH